MRKLFLMKLASAVILVCALLLIQSSPFPCSLASPGLPIWMGFMHDSLHSGRTGAEGCNFPQLKWTFDTHDPISSTPVIDEEGAIYLLTNSGTLYSIFPDGTEKWRYETSTGDPLASFWVTPLISPWDGDIYFGASNQMVAIRPDGSLKWRISLPDAVNGSPNFNLTRLVQSVKALRVYTLSWEDGTWGVLGDMGPGGEISFPSATGGDFSQYCPCGHTLFCLDRDNISQWSYTCSSQIFSPSVDSDGIIYIHTVDKLIALRSNGSAKWSIDFKATSLAAIGWHNTLYMGCADKCFYALDPETGATIWKFTEGNSLFSAPTVDGNGVIYFGSTDGKLYALTPSGEKKWSFYVGAAVTAPPSIAEDGTIYFGATDGKLYALEEGPAPPPSSSSTPSSPPSSFPDVPLSFWAYDEITTLASAGVIVGYPDGTFRPEFPVTRAEFAKMALLSFGLTPEIPPTPSFPDVPLEHWAYSYIEGAVKNNLVLGYPDGTFQPEGNITIAEVLTVIVRARGWLLQNPFGPPPYILLRDLDDSVRPINSGDWFYQYVGASAANGLILFPDYAQITAEGAGSGEYMVKFNSPSTRAQTAVFLSRVLIP